VNSAIPVKAENTSPLCSPSRACNWALCCSYVPSPVRSGKRAAPRRTRLSR
jgi:hypothetical protein